MAWVIARHGARGTRYTGAYRDPDGRTRAAGLFSTRREALRAADREEQKVLAGAWDNNAQGDITFRDYVEKERLPNKHVEASTRAAYISYLDKHFYPIFGHHDLNKDLTLTGPGFGHPRQRQARNRRAHPAGLWAASVISDSGPLLK